MVKINPKCSLGWMKVKILLEPIMSQINTHICFPSQTLILCQVTAENQQPRYSPEMYCNPVCCIFFFFTRINPILKPQERFLHTASCNMCQKNKWLCKWQLFDAWDAVIYNMPAVHTETNLSAISDFLSTAQALWAVNYFLGLSSHTRGYLHTHTKCYLAMQKVIATCLESVAWFNLFFQPKKET